MAPPPLLNRKQAAAYLNLSQKTLESDISRNRLGVPFIRLGRAVRYRQNDLDNWLDALQTLTETEVGVRNHG